MAQVSLRQAYAASLASNNPSSPAAPQLCLVQQTSLAEETVSQNGLVRSVHVLVKNTPFQLTIGFTHSGALPSNYNFNRLALDVSLLYDCDSLKPVSYIKTKPVSYKPKFSENGDQVTFNCRLKVLTSQHEDMFFRVKIRALQPVTQQEFNPPLEVISLPIKVVSKPEQLKGRRKTATNSSSSGSVPTSALSSNTGSSSSTTISSSTTVETSSPPSRTNRGGSKKRSLTDMLVETVNRLEKQQQVHQKLLEQICDPSNNLAIALGISADLVQRLQEGSSEGGSEPCAKKQRIREVLTPALAVIPGAHNTTSTTEGSTSVAAQAAGAGTLEEVAKEQCEEIFVRFLEAYTQLKPEDRGLVVRKIVRSRSTKETEQLVELVDLLSSEGLHRSIGSVEEGGIVGGHSGVSGECTCIMCPHRKELEKIDEFYSTFFT